MDRAPYPAALRLYLIAEERWPEIDTEYLSTDLLRLPAVRFCNAVYTWCLHRIEDDKREQWEYMLNAPLPGQEERVTENVAEVEGAAFMQMMETNQKLKGGSGGGDQG